MAEAYTDKVCIVVVWFQCLESFPCAMSDIEWRFSFFS